MSRTSKETRRECALASLDLGLKIQSSCPNTGNFKCLVWAQASQSLASTHLAVTCVGHARRHISHIVLGSFYTLPAVSDVAGSADRGRQSPTCACDFAAN